MFKKHPPALSIIPLALITVSTVTHAATPVIGGSANYELLYGGAISNETPKVYGEIPVETKDLAATLEHHTSTAVRDSGNLVIPIPEMEGATLVRAHTQPDDANPTDVMIRVGGVDIDDVLSDFDISIVATGDTGQVGTLEFVAFKDAAVIGHLVSGGDDRVYVMLGHHGNGIESPQDWARSVTDRTLNASAGNYMPVNYFSSNEWSTSTFVNTDIWTDAELFSLIYSADMELIFPETDYPDQWSAVLDIEMEVL